jgi:hypothetical protein
MTKIEKFILVILVMVVGTWVTIAALLVSEVEEAGGMRAVIVETGKEIKSIYNEIQEDAEEIQEDVQTNH